MYDISVAIVVYKNYSEAVEAIKSIEKYTIQTIKKKIYVIDNSVTEDIQKEKKEFLEEIICYKDVEFIDTGNNLGFGRGHNYILHRLDSKFHAIVNPDIIIKEDVFSNIISFMCDETIGMCIPRIVDQNNELQRVYRRDITVVDVGIRMFFCGLFKKRQERHTLQDKDYTKPFQVPFGQGSFLVIRTELFKEIGGFDDRFFMYLEDADLCKRVNQISKLMYCPYATVVHKWEKGSHKDFKLFRMHMSSMYAYFKKWGFKLL